MLKNSKVVLFVTLKRRSGRKLLDPTTYINKSAVFQIPNIFQSFKYINTHYITDVHSERGWNETR